jgi:nicotinamide-nucleotide amidase
VTGLQPRPRDQVEIVTVGDEILLGATLDANAAFLARELAAAGFQVRRKTTLPDDLPALRQGLREVRARGGVVIVTGGLGPTPDDLTRHALAEVFARPLTTRPELVAVLEERFRAFGVAHLPRVNLSQAELPEGASAIPNRRGSAAGILLEDGESTFYALPGVPAEMRTMFREEVLPRLRERAGGGLVPVRQRLLRTAGIGESVLAERIADLVRGRDVPRVAYLPDLGSVDVRLSVAGLPPEEADAAIAGLEGALTERLAEWVYGRDDDTLEGAAGAALAARGLRLAIAESCTGGLVSSLVTDVPGSSGWFAGAVVAYDDAVKRDLLGVSGDTLARFGAVSRETCAEMLRGARTRFGTACAVAVTGIAGPGGGTAAKPVGLVHLGVDVEGDVRLEVRRWPGTRREIKARAARTALLLLLRAVEARPA